MTAVLGIGAAVALRVGSLALVTAGMNVHMAGLRDVVLLYWRDLNQKY